MEPGNNMEVKADESDGSSSLRCTQCDAVFEDVLALLAHLDSHSSKCPICNKEFSSKEFLDNHMKSHTSGAQSTESENSDVNKANSPENTEETESNTILIDNNIEGNSDPGINQSEVTETIKESTASENENGDGKSENGTNEELEKGSVNEKVVPIEKEKSLKDEVSNASPAPSSNGIAKTEKPYRCSKCKYMAKCVASVNIHQRRQHPGEFATVISTIDDTEIKTDQGKKQSNRNQDLEDSEDEEVRRTLQSPRTDSDDDTDEYDDGGAGGGGDADGKEEKEKPQEYRCSMCDFTAKDTDTVFEHQRNVHPKEWQLSSGMLSPDNKEGEAEGTGEEAANEATGEAEMEDDVDPIFELPIEIDQFSSMGRSIIAGSMGVDATGKMHGEQNYMNQPGAAAMANSGEYRPDSRTYQCSNCPAYFYEQGQLRRHHSLCRNTETLNQAIARYRCRLCKRIFPDKNSLFPHLLSHKRNFPCFRCSDCGYRGKFEGTIVAHIHHRHPGSPGATVERIAGVAEINAVLDCWEYLGPAQGQNNKEGALEAEEVTDPDVQKLIGGLSQSFAENNSHGGGTVNGGDSSNSHGEFDNQSMTSEFSDDSQQESSAWSVEAISQLKVGSHYMCPECPVMFREGYKLRRHLDTHGGFKPHVCKICNKRFTRSEHLKRHRVIHANTKPYMCSVCCYSAKRLDNLQKHQRIKHYGEKCEIITVSKEMIEAEIAANENARAVTPQVPQAPRPQLVSLPKLPQHMPMPVKAKRGRPRKISSPDDNFLFCRDPDYKPTATPLSLPSTAGGSSYYNNINSLSFPNAFPQNANGMHMDLSMNFNAGGNLMYNSNLNDPLFMNYNSSPARAGYFPYPVFGSPSMSSTPMKMPGVDLSNISAAAAAAAMNEINNAIEKVDNQEVKTSDPDDKTPQLSESTEQISTVSASEPTDAEQLPVSSGPTGFTDSDSKLSTTSLGNRGKYQCHVCDRPFSYLKPFKKHLLCHGDFMPYECSTCGHQTKRRDMMQDHQRDMHIGEICEIIVNEPTSDMHDMMDTYIHQVPEQMKYASEDSSHALAPSTSIMQAQSSSQSSDVAGGPNAKSSSISEIDRSRVDPRMENLNLPLGLVKMEPTDKAEKDDQKPTSDTATSKPFQHASIIRTRRQLSREENASASQQIPAAQSENQNQKQSVAQHSFEFTVKEESQRSTSSPVTFSLQTPSSGTGLVKPRPRRANMIKFKVLSPHTRNVRSQLPDGPTDNLNKDDSMPVKEEDIETEMSAVPQPKVKREIEFDMEETPSKRPKLGENSQVTTRLPQIKQEKESFDWAKTSNLSQIKQEKESFDWARPLQSLSEGPGNMIGKAPKVPITGLRPGRPPVPVAENFVVNIKSHKGSPKEKQGDNHRFVCSVCDQRFAYTKPFKRHLLVHGGFEPYKCNACGHHTTSRDSMKVHQNKKHKNQRGVGITVVEPTPEMEQSLISQGLFQEEAPTAASSEEDEENPANKSIVETARMEQHMMAAAMKSLSSTVKENQEEDEDEQTSFPQMLGLRPANPNNNTKGDNEAEKGENVEAEKKNTSGDSKEGIRMYDDLSDMPVDDAIFANLQTETALIIEPKGPGATCQLCNKSFQCSSKLQRHMVSHTGIKAYECQICYKKLTRLEHLKRHLLTHGNVKPYRCSACKFDAKRLDIVQLHQKMEHAGELVDIVYLFAPSVLEADSKCGFPIDDGASEEGNFECQVCGMSFVSSGHLLAHQKIHTLTKPYECYICQKTFTRPEHLKRHRLVHDDTKPYRCSECGFKTKRLDGMKEHQRSRHPELPVFIIDTILPQNAAVKRMVDQPPMMLPRDTLEGLELMHCDKCCLAFYDRNRFRQHKQAHIPSPTKPQDLTCHLCGVRVSQAKHLRRHMLLHESHIPYQCSLCGYSAKRTDHMKLHFRKQHPEGGAQMICFAKDGTSEISGSVSISDDSISYGSSLGEDSFFEGYTAGEIAEADLTLEQLNAMAQDTSEFGNSSLYSSEADNMDISQDFKAYSKGEEDMDNSGNLVSQNDISDAYGIAEDIGDGDAVTEANIANTIEDISDSDAATQANVANKIDDIGDGDAVTEANIANTIEDIADGDAVTQANVANKIDDIGDGDAVTEANVANTIEDIADSDAVTQANVANNIYDIGDGDAVTQANNPDTIKDMDSGNPYSGFAEQEMAQDSEMMEVTNNDSEVTTNDPEEATDHFMVKTS